MNETTERKEEKETVKDEAILRATGGCEEEEGGEQEGGRARGWKGGRKLRKERRAREEWRARASERERADTPHGTDCRQIFIQRSLFRGHRVTAH
eukprot:6174684-Pleurochrysis_carterae.AAC.1